MSTKLGTILADFTTALSTDIAVGGTTATLSSATDDDGVALPSGRYFFTLDGSNSSKEHISCDLVGTALTNIKSLSRQGVETTGAVRKHRIGTSVSLTDFGHIKFINDLVSGATTLNALEPLGYDAAPSSLAGNQLATVTYVLGVVNGGTVTFDKQIVPGQTSGEALTVNDIVYFKEADAKWYKVDADLTTTFDQLQMGVAQSTVNSNTTVSIGISGPQTGFSGLTPGSKYYASNTPGLITTTAGTYSVFVGWALSATVLLFDSVGKTLPTQKEKDALAGSQGVPSSTNKYISQDNVYTSETDQIQTTQNAVVEIGEANATTKKNKLAQSFTPSITKIRGVKLYKTADTGTFTGTVTVSLQADTSGSPSGSDLATVTLSNTNWLALAVGEFSAIFTTEYTSMVAGSLYWIVITTSTSDTINHPNIGTNSAGGYGSGSVKYNNTTDGWVTVSTIDLYFKTLQGVNNQISVPPFVQTFTVSGNWIKPSSTMPFKALVECWAGGGSGGKAVTGASGGGGGAYNQAWIDSSNLSSTEIVTIGAGGVGITAANTAGNVGGNTSFGTKVLAYGGGGGATGTSGSGGGGGGTVSAGITVGAAHGGSPRMEIVGGFGYCTNGAAVAGIENSLGGGGGGGATGGNGGAGGNSVYGGGGGGAQQTNGGNSVYGGGGGGGGNTTTTGGTSIFGGSGGAGATAGAGGTNGTFPSGGGGGTNSGTTSGAGGAGQVKVTLFF